MLRFLLFEILVLCTYVLSTPVTPAKDERIIGGSEASIEQFPYLVSVKYLNLHRCGGILYHFRVVLISANCVVGLDMYDFTITAGITNLNDDEGITQSVQYIIYHDDFDPEDNSNDLVAMLIPFKAFYFTNTIQPISLARSGEEVAAGSKGVIAGWGALTSAGAVSTKLEYRDVYVYSKEECAERYKSYREITDDMLCAGPWSGTGGVCNGDYGGPLVIGNRLFGIISWTKDCGNPLYPPVYVKASAVHDWIDFKIKDMGSMLGK